ncbi:cytochrome P450 [Stipitochalara longipes BDJ]|nr:cytochrome P450 [Stipitochalara longipes BDJ]
MAAILENSNIYVLLISGLALGTLVLWQLQSRRIRDPREPPMLPAKIPYIGHILGLIIHQAEYFQQLASRTTFPIFSLKMLSGELYVVTSPELIKAIVKNPKVFTFDEIFAVASASIFGLTKRQMDILKEPRVGSNERYPIAKDTQHVMHTTMISGPPLFQLNTRALNRFAKFVNPIGPKGQDVKLYEWMRHTFTLATMEAIYGPINPFSENESLIVDLQHFEDDIGLLYLNFLPQYTAHAGYKARITIGAAFKKYYDNKHNLDASALIKGRYKALTQGYNTDDVSSFDIGMCVAATTNSIPGSFWFLIRIFSSSVLLASLREELQPLVTRKPGSDEAIINAAGFMKNCPLLISTWQETLRSIAATVTARTVTEDTMLDGQFLLKKGSYIQMAAGPMHSSPAIWGPDAQDFDPSRFMPSTVSSLPKAEQKQRKTAFAPFGGGAILCPGRYFASTEILGIVATMVLGFEVLSKDGGQLKLPSIKKQTMAVQVRHPVGDMDVTIKRRNGWEDVKFGYDVVGDGAVEGEGLVFD